MIDPTPPASSSRPSTRDILLTIGVLAVIVGIPATIRWILPPRTSLQSVSERPIPSAHDADLQAIRKRAWERILPFLKETDKTEADQISIAAQTVNAFFADRQQRTREFAKAILSLAGKWPLVKSKLPYADSDSHLKYLSSAFAEKVFSPDELRETIESAIRSYVSAIEGNENRLLVQIRADLKDSDLGRGGSLPAIGNNDIFRREYEKMVQSVVPILATSLPVDISREFVGLFAADVATKIATRVAIAAATRMGVSAGLLGAGVASGLATFGVSLVAFIVVDIAIDWLLNISGYDPEGQVAAKVDGTLESVRALLVDGNSDAWQSYKKLRELQNTDPDKDVRSECRKAADSISKSGNLGLSHELTTLHEARAAIRRAALEKLILHGGSQ